MFGVKDTQIYLCSGSFQRFVIYLCLRPIPTYTHQQSPRRRLSVLSVLNAAPSGILAKLVVAVTVVLGSGTVDLPVTQKLITRGPRASGHVHNPRDPLDSS